ncbi:Uncharacterised protein [Amycolatopsis camponoti]|uniref:Uncharacterized protein n=1 Tax=Amycolatopsis camponoti TaxID=2606593 RepID=A0A6I8LZ46_9PSEU|nr:hypothetical protein [Amycolatopsis camponoti]VVJ22746.1 Uncharacterised protein [Amycolatopsis camponoti]
MRVHVDVDNEFDETSADAWRDEQFDQRMGDLGEDIRQRIYQGLWDVCIIGGVALDLGEIAGRGWLWREHRGCDPDDEFAAMVRRLARRSPTAVEERIVLERVQDRFALKQAKIELLAASVKDAGGLFGVAMSTDLICGSRITMVMAELERIDL